MKLRLRHTQPCSVKAWRAFSQFGGSSVLSGISGPEVKCRTRFKFNPPWRTLLEILTRAGISNLLTGESRVLLTLGPRSGAMQFTGAAGVGARAI